MARVVVAGGAGFLGSHLCDRLLAEGHEVVAVDNFLTGRRENLAHLENDSRFRLIEHDVSLPLELPGPVDYVMHLASPASPAEYVRCPIETLRAGSFATHLLLDLAVEKGARFLLASTSEVYGDPPPEHHPQKESFWGCVNPNGPRSMYDEAKRYAEAATMAYHRKYGIATRIIRIFNTYGPRMQPNDGRVVTNFITQALRGAPITLYGEGTQTRSFCYVSDLIDGMYRLLLSGETDPVNIGNPNEFSVAELAQIVLRIANSSSAVVYRPLPPDDPRQRQPDITKARRVLGWEPLVSLEDGLRRTVEYIKTRL